MFTFYLCAAFFVALLFYLAHHGARVERVLDALDAAVGRAVARLSFMQRVSDAFDALCRAAAGRLERNKKGLKR